MARSSRREFVRRLGGTALTLIGLVSACVPAGSQSPPNSTAPGTARTVAPTQVQTGGTLSVGQTASIQTIAPYPANNSSHIFRWAMFNPLVSLDAQAQPV